ncbi:hypothetical protein CC80DRAFT_548757 [Byssothecium circinans]|uniref:Uncharacterized protein n=1 Tax=Byssothecium circinans TaxID=147558 RepID=A0A6A5TYA5_9PLEO|nr:hypothetical protein CC80DRAFT_548757 [Byssothecium circinans]
MVNADPAAPTVTAEIIIELLQEHTGNATLPQSDLLHWHILSSKPALYGIRRHLLVGYLNRRSVYAISNPTLARAPLSLYQVLNPLDRKEVYNYEFQEQIQFLEPFKTIWTQNMSDWGAQQVRAYMKAAFILRYPKVKCQMKFSTSFRGLFSSIISILQRNPSEAAYGVNSRAGGNKTSGADTAAIDNPAVDTQHPSLKTACSRNEAVNPYMEDRRRSSVTSLSSSTSGSTMSSPSPQRQPEEPTISHALRADTPAASSFVPINGKAPVAKMVAEVDTKTLKRAIHHPSAGEPSSLKPAAPTQHAKTNERRPEEPDSIILSPMESLTPSPSPTSPPTRPAKQPPFKAYFTAWDRRENAKTKQIATVSKIKQIENEAREIRRKFDAQIKEKEAEKKVQEMAYEAEVREEKRMGQYMEIVRGGLSGSEGFQLGMLAERRAKRQKRC